MSRGPRSSLAAAVLALTLTPGAAMAGGDDMWGTCDHMMTEWEHHIELSFERGYATMIVRRSVHNGAERPDEAAYGISLPRHAVARGLRTRGYEHGKVRWYVGELLESDEAAERYFELTGMDPDIHPDAPGPSRPRDPALLAWESLGELSLHVFPVAASGDQSVEYTLDIPATWDRGRWVLDLDDMGLDELPAQLTVKAAERGDRLFVDDQAVEQGQRVVLDIPHTITLEPHDPTVASLELASIDTGHDRAVTHWRLALGPAISKVPRQVRAVIALDLSCSLEDAEVEAERSAALAYLEHLRAPALAAKVAVIGFDRQVHAVTEGWVSPDQAMDALRGASLERGNGSAVELALGSAADLFESAPRGAPRRVLLMTDFLTSSSRSQIDYELAALRTKAIVHLAELSEGTPWLARDDRHAASHSWQHDWARVAANTQGVVWRAAAPSVHDADEHRLAVELFEEWARPLRVEALEVDLGEALPLDPDLPTILQEGEGMDALLLTSGRVDEITISGLTWNMAVAYTARRDSDLSERWAGLVFGSELIDELLDEEMLQLALRGGAVSPVTSYLAVEPGAQPSDMGVQRDWGRGWGLIGRGGGGGTGSGYGRSKGVAFGGRLDRQAWLEQQLSSAWSVCGGAGRGASFDIEATYDELVDFELKLSGVADLALEACVSEATWALSLPPADFIDSRSRWTVVLAPT